MQKDSDGEKIVPKDKARVIRLFWAKFLDSKVLDDGQVPGFGAWWNEADTRARVEASKLEERCWQKYLNREPLEKVVAGSVQSLRWFMDALEPIQVAPISVAKPEIESILGAIKAFEDREREKQKAKELRRFRACPTNASMVALEAKETSTPSGTTSSPGKESSPESNV